MQSMGRFSVANLYKTLTTLNSRRGTPPPFQLYCTATVNSDCDSVIVVDTHNVDENGSIISNKPTKKKRGKQTLKQSILSNISAQGDLSSNVTSMIDEWVKKRIQVRFSEVLRIIRDLRKLSRFSEALQLSEWLKNNEAFTFSPAEHAVQIDLIAKVHGIISAETYFHNLSEEDITEKTSVALLHYYIRQRDTIKALSHVQSMKEKGLKLSSVVYHDLMSLCNNTDKHETKENGVTLLDDEIEQQPDVSVDWNAYAIVADFYCKEGLTAKAYSLLKFAEEKIPVGNVDDAYSRLISLHANLGNKSEVYRLWGIKKKTFEKLVNSDYINIFSNLLKLNEFEEAEKILEEWKASGNDNENRIMYIFIDKYIAKGEYGKAEGMLKDMIEKGRSPDADKWGRVVAGHLDLGNTTSAVECMKIALSTDKDKKWKPDRSLMIRLLVVLGVEKNEKSDINTLVGTFLTRTSSEEKTNTSTS